jgi:hypothetical protein
MNDNLKLWRAVEKTDPSLTKNFSRGGGFQGTAINPTSLIMRATEMFGPPGIGWGYEIVKEEMLVGAPLTETCNELTHCLQVKVWYVLDGKRGEIEQFGATTYVGKNKYGPFTDEEAKKKTLTDAISKCLSWLGFSADVHLGRYDDNKYVNDLRKEFAEEKSKASDEQMQAKRQAYLDKLATLNDETIIKTFFLEAASGLGLQKATPEFAEFRKLFVQRIEELNPPPRKEL